MDECREAFEDWAKDQDLDITIVDFTGSVKLIDRDGNQRQFCYEEFETDTAWKAWQSRQAEIDQLKSLLEKDEYAHNLYYENLNLQTSIDEKDKRINQALNFINNWWHPDLDQKLFVEAVANALRGES